MVATGVPSLSKARPMFGDGDPVNHRAARSTAGRLMQRRASLSAYYWTEPHACFPSMLDGSCSGLSVFSFILGGNYCQCSIDDHSSKNVDRTQGEIFFEAEV
jgi:hypothetical protein